MEKFSQESGILLVDRMIIAIQENKQYLSDIDGAIGDGDHGINMNKGFTLCRDALDKQSGDLSYGLKTLGKILLMKIGGSMGPLYGKFFAALGKSFEGKEMIGKEDFLDAMKGALEAIRTISPWPCLTRPGFIWSALSRRRSDHSFGFGSSPTHQPRSLLTVRGTASWLFFQGSFV